MNGEELHATGLGEVYRRELPGGGYAAIEVSERRLLLGRREFRGRVIVERRARDSRRREHQPPVVAEACRRSRIEVLDALFPIVLSNTALAAGVRPLRRR